MSHASVSTDRSKFFALATQVLSIPRGGVEMAQALVAIPGIVIDAPVKYACQKHWQREEDTAEVTFLIAGHHDEKLVTERFAQEVVCEHFNIIPRSGVFSQGRAKHAGDQAQWIAGQVVELDLKSLALFVPAFHMTRVYLTTLEALRRVGKRIPIIPMPVPLSPFEKSVMNFDTGELSFCQMDVIHGEADPRMENYQKEKGDGSHGDVATISEFEEYLAWLYQQPIVAEYTMSAL
jgi:hypothetical protein